MKTKFNSKLLLVLGIMLMTIFAFNLKSVYAVEVNANTLESLPTTLEVGIPTTKAIDEDGYISAKIVEEVEAAVEKIIGAELPTGQLTVGFNSDVLLDVAKVDLKLYDTDMQTNLIASKTVTIKYTDNWNQADSDYVKNKCKDINLQLSANVDYTDKRDSDTVIEEAYSELINDSSIKCTFHSNTGIWSFPDFYAHGILVFTKNDVVYYTVSTQGNAGIPTMTIPESVEDTEEAYMNYVISELGKLEKFADVELKMEKYEEGDKNEYFLYCGSPDPAMILLNKDISKVKVESIDKDTNVKLETVGAVVPTNTIMEVKTVKEGTVFDTVKKVVTDAKNYKVFDITLESDGKKIQPNGNVKISIPVPNDMGTENLVVYRVAEDGKKTEYKVTVETVDGLKYATFETNHFSTYVLAELSVKEDNQQNTNNKPVVDNDQNTNTNNDKLDESPKMGVNDIMIIFASFLAVISLASIVITKRMK